MNALIISTGTISSALSVFCQDILTSKIRNVNIALLAWFSTSGPKFVSSVQLTNLILMAKNVLLVYSLNIGIEKRGYALLAHMEEFITRTLINANATKISFGQDIAALNAIILNILI